MNPVPYNDWMQLAIDFNNTAKDLNLALATCNYYYIETDTAIKEIVKIQETIRENWRELADKYRISKSEQDRMKKAFAKSETDGMDDEESEVFFPSDTPDSD